MTFSEFAKKIAGVLKGKANQADFVEMLFSNIIPEDKYYLVEELSESTWKGYYQGNSINVIARSIVTDTDPVLFEEYINHQGSAAEKLCDVYRDDIPGINVRNAGILIGELFEQIIREAAADSDRERPPIMPGLEMQFGKGVHVVNAGYIALPKVSTTYLPGSFQKYADKAEADYSMKKTLLYFERKRPFYNMYVCNDLRLHRGPGGRRSDDWSLKKDMTVSALEQFSKCSIIQGTGGIGKSMFMTHLFLSSVNEYKKDGRLPVLVLLKDYKEKYPDLITVILNALQKYDPDITQQDVIRLLEENNLILLLDGLDEIQSQLKESFDDNLDSFVKRYPECQIVLSSRPISDFVSYQAFVVYDICPLREEQAVEMVERLEFWDEEAKLNFLKDLKNHLYSSHTEFASNPLLLTIMLMTYSMHGDIPAKMHSFYRKAYETMARLHDNTKGSYVRPLHTNLTPERFADYFAQFCARSFVKEQLEFTKDEFSEYMKKVISSIPKESSDEGAVLMPSAFLKDLTDNLCIMYCEGDKLYFTGSPGHQDDLGG